MFFSDSVDKRVSIVVEDVLGMVAITDRIARKRGFDTKTVIWTPSAHTPPGLGL